jgi:hypothetical protein
MAEPTNTPLAGEIQLSIDDLLAPLPETVRLGGPGPFVINLSASTSPISVPAKGIAGCEHAHVYQLQRVEDRRPRYRLRLGPFATEDEADAILKKVRDIYPGALLATADADDLRSTAILRAKADALQSPADKPAEPLQPEAVASTASATPKAFAMPMASTTTKTSAAPKASAMPAASTMTRTSAAPKASGAPKVSAGPAAEQKIPVLRVSSVLPTLSVPLPRQAQQPSSRVPNLETTQTVRALTQLELEDDKASRWFVIQLALSEDAFDPDTVPNLDIFSAYRLYSVAGIDQGRIVHALRLGFFGEQAAAGAVASYLAAFYDKPTIKRVSAAERERFAEQSLEPRKDVGATGRHAVIEITNERFVREKRSGKTAAK